MRSCLDKNSVVEIFKKRNPRNESDSICYFDIAKELDLDVRSKKKVKCLKDACRDLISEGKICSHSSKSGTRFYLK